MLHYRHSSIKSKAIAGCRVYPLASTDYNGVFVIAVERHPPELQQEEFVKGHRALSTFGQVKLHATSNGASHRHNRRGGRVGQKTDFCCMSAVKLFTAGSGRHRRIMRVRLPEKWARIATVEFAGVDGDAMVVQSFALASSPAKRISSYWR